jgi:hypothetical protein
MIEFIDHTNTVAEKRPKGPRIGAFETLADLAQ